MHPHNPEVEGLSEVLVSTGRVYASASVSTPRSGPVRSWEHALQWLVFVLLSAGLAPREGRALEARVLRANDGRPVAGVSVALLAAGARGSFREVERSVSDTTGRVRFSFADLVPRSAFELRASYQGVELPASLLRVGEQDEIVVEVFPVSRDSNVIEIDAERLFVVLQGDEVAVTRWVQVVNQSAAVYVGDGEGQDRRVTPFYLPAGAYAVWSDGGSLAREGASLAYDRRVLAPGLTQLAFAFRMDARTLGGAYEQQILLPTGRLDVYVTPVDLPLGEDFEDLGTVVLGNERYHHGRSTNLPRGTWIQVPVPGFRDWASVLRWSTLAGVGLAVVGAALLSARAGRGRGESSAEFMRCTARWMRYRNELIECIRVLDEGAGESWLRERLLDEAVLATAVLELLDGFP